MNKKISKTRLNIFCWVYICFSYIFIIFLLYGEKIISIIILFILGDIFYIYLTVNINTVITYDPTHEYEELKYMITALRNDLLQYDIDKWKIIRFYPLRGKEKENRETFWIPDEDFIEIKNRYKSDGPFLTVDVRDIKQLDDNFVVSPCGLLKKSSKGVEEVIVDLKPGKGFKGGERHV